MSEPHNLLRETQEPGPVPLLIGHSLVEEAQEPDLVLAFKDHSLVDETNRGKACWREGVDSLA
jgi:hypothetical protein